MKSVRRIVSLISVIIAIFASSCMLDLEFEDTSIESETEQMIQNILDAVEAQDRDALKALFSENAKKNTDLDAGIDYLFDYVQGEDILYTGETWEEMPAGHTSTNKSEGKRRAKVERYTRFMVDEEPYIIFIIFSPIDEFTPDDVGLNALRITRDAYMIENYYEKHLVGEGEDAEWVEGIMYGNGLTQMSEGIFVPDGTIENYLGVVVTE